MRKISHLILAFTMVANSLAYAESPFQSCASGTPLPSDVSNPAFLLQELELTKEIGSELIQYLERGQGELQALKTAIIPYLDKGFPEATVEQCNSLVHCRFFLHDIHVYQSRMRIYAALSWAPRGRGPMLGDLNVAGNPDLLPPPFGPLDGKQEPLTPEERQKAQAELIQFWDGLSEEERELQSFISGQPIPKRSGVIEEYMNLLRRKKDLTFQHSQRYDEITDELLRFEQSRKLPTAKERVDKVMRFADLDWIGYRDSRLHAKRKLILLEMWRLVDQFRPLVYLKSAEVSPRDLLVSLELSQKDGKAMIEKIRGMQKNFAGFSRVNARDLLNQSYSARQARYDMEWLMDLQVYTEATLERRPDLCPAALNLRAQIDRRNSLKNFVTAGFVLAPMVLLVPPLALAVGAAGATMITVGSIGATGIASYGAINDYRDQYQKYMVKPAAQDPPLTNLNQLLNSQKMAVAVPVGAALSIGIPALRAGSVTRLLTAPTP